MAGASRRLDDSGRAGVRLPALLVGVAALGLCWSTRWSLGGLPEAAVDQTPLVLFELVFHLIAAVWIARREPWVAAFVVLAAVTTLRWALPPDAARWIALGGLALVLMEEAPRVRAGIIVGGHHFL